MKMVYQIVFFHRFGPFKFHSEYESRHDAIRAQGKLIDDQLKLSPSEWKTYKIVEVPQVPKYDRSGL